MALSLQEIFDRVSTHLLAQKRRSMKGTRCKYRSDCLKCAVGVLIPDELYDPIIDSEDVYQDTSVYGIAYYLEKIKVITSHDRKIRGASKRLQLLADLQDLHDTYHPNQWKKRLKAVAQEHNLVFNP